MSVGTRIKELRIQKGLSQEELGAMVGVQKAAINKYESEIVVNIKRATIEKLSRALDVSPAYLMCYDANEKNTAPAGGHAIDAVDDDLRDYLDTLRSRDEMRMLFSVTKGATKDQIEAIVQMIEVMRKDEIH